MVPATCKHQPTRANPVPLSGIWTVYSGRSGPLVKRNHWKATVSKEVKWLSHCSGRAPEDGPICSLLAEEQSEPLLVCGWSYCISKAAEVQWDQVRFPRAYSHTHPYYFVSPLLQGFSVLYIQGHPPTWPVGPVQGGLFLWESFWLQFNSYYSSLSARDLMYFISNSSFSDEESRRH